jgi:hypothetical protein
MAIAYRSPKELAAFYASINYPAGYEGRGEKAKWWR